MASVVNKNKPANLFRFGDAVETKTAQPKINPSECTCMWLGAGLKSTCRNCCDAQRKRNLKEEADNGGRFVKIGIYTDANERIEHIQAL